MKNTIYIRTLKKAEHTVFVVEDGQKSYFDPQFRRSVPYSSGQQVKRSILDTLNEILGLEPSPTTFISELNNKEIKEAEAFSLCDPSYPDQLFGGWMKAAKGGKERTLKRRSPISISAMRGLHPLLANIDKENISFDRSDRQNSKIIVRDKNGKELTKAEIAKLLEGKDRSLTRKWIRDVKRATGLFVHDIAIDLRRLFSITINPLEPEITKETEEKLKNNGWIEGQNFLGPCLIAPKEIREKWANGLADALIKWRITSNQSRTFSLMETLAIAIGLDASTIPFAIRAELNNDGENQTARPIIDEDLEDVEVFVTPAASAHLMPKTERAKALELARDYILKLILEYDFENTP